MEHARVSLAADFALLEAVGGFHLHLGPHAIAIAVKPLGGDLDPVPPLALIVQHPATGPNIHAAIAVEISHERSPTQLVNRRLRMELTAVISERLQPLVSTGEQVEVAVVVEVSGKQRPPAGRSRRFSPDEGAASLVYMHLYSAASRDRQIHIAILIEILDGQARALHGTQAQSFSDFRKRAVAIVGLHLHTLGRKQDYIHVAVVVEVGECSPIRRDRTGRLSRSGKAGLPVVGQQ